MKHRSNEEILRVEQPPLIHTLPGLEKILHSAERWVRPFETLESAWYLSPWGDNAWGTRFSLHLALWVVDPCDLTGEEGPILRPSQGESFLRCRTSLASTAFWFPFGGPQGPANPNPWQLCSGALLGGKEECCWEEHITHLLWVLGDIIQMRLTHPSVLTCTTNRVGQYWVCKGGSRVQAKQTYKVLLNQLLSSDCGLCTQLLWMATVCSQLCKSGWEVQDFALYKWEKERWGNTFHSMLTYKLFTLGSVLL